jgi:hypothetical protein
MRNVPRKIKTIYLYRFTQTIAAIGIVSIATLAVVPLHAQDCIENHKTSEKHHSDSSDHSRHDPDHCSICQFLFGASGKTLPPEAGVELEQPVVYHIDIVEHQFFIGVENSRHIIPRAPPVM